MRMPPSVARRTIARWNRIPPPRDSCVETLTVMLRVRRLGAPGRPDLLLHGRDVRVLIE